jgi:hypothetical protein
MDGNSFWRSLSSSAGHTNAMRGAEIYLWEKAKPAALELELVQSTAA